MDNDEELTPEEIATLLDLVKEFVESDTAEETSENDPTVPITTK